MWIAKSVDDERQRPGPIDGRSRSLGGCDVCGHGRGARPIRQARARRGRFRPHQRVVYTGAAAMFHAMPKIRRAPAIGDDPVQRPTAGEHNQQEDGQVAQYSQAAIGCAFRSRPRTGGPPGGRVNREPARNQQRNASAATNGALIRKSAIAMLIIALIVASPRDAAVERRSECSASTAPAMASKAPTRDAGYSAPPSGAASASSPSTSVTTASAGSRVRDLTFARGLGGVTDSSGLPFAFNVAERRAHGKGPSDSTALPC